jgi:serine/threonine protein kinase
MDPARWDRVQELFNRALELDGNERSSFLNAACAEDPPLLALVQRMLEQDSREWLLDRDVVEVAGSVSDETLSASFKEFSPYRLLRMVGEGGMGVVYLAERKDLGNRVAIKILRDAWLSPARRERFNAEQRTLAQLNHPSIARLYDASTLPDGTPWFVMEYVDGVPITDYCAHKNCSVEERLLLLRSVADAVQYAHRHGIIHRDLKPSNILVKNDGSVRLLDFGIAKQLDAEGRPATHTRTAFRQMTTAYASPEQLRGEPVGVLSDVYSLGVVLYELLAGKPPFDLSRKNLAEAEATISLVDPPKPSAVTQSAGKSSWANIDALCLKTMEKDPLRRYSSVAALIHDIDHYLNHEPLEARAESWVSSLARMARRNVRTIGMTAAAAALVAAAVAGTLFLTRKPGLAPARSKSVAVLPFENGERDHSLDYLSIALPDQISRTLDYGRRLTVRAPQLAFKFAGPGVEPAGAGRQLGVDDVVTGRFMRAGDQLQITLNLIDVETNRSIWTDVFEVPTQNVVALQGLVAAKTRRTMAPVLGVTEFASDNLPRPRNEEAYRLYLQVLPQPDLISIDPVARKRGTEMLEKSVSLDPSFSPAWVLLASIYSGNYWWGNGGKEALEKWRGANRKVLELEPDNLSFRAGILYDLAHRAVQEGGIPPGEAYRGVEDLVRRRPDSARLHFMASWILREAGLLEESARECDASMMIDAKDAGSRSCGITFMLLGKYSRAMDFLRLDAAAEISRGISLDILLREGKQRELLQSSQKVPQWSGYSMVIAYLQHHPPAEIAAAAVQMPPTPDAETNYLSATHLAYVGQIEAALTMLKRPVEEGYCSYPGMDSDPLLANVRSQPAFAQIRAAGEKCQSKFLTDRASNAPRSGTEFLIKQ